jgi:hypothetical protein
MNPAGALRSTGITPLPHYYGPLRLPTRPTGSYGFPSVVDPDTGSPSRVSQVPVLIFRRPLSRVTPEDPSAANARCCAAGIRLHPIRKAGHPHWCNEAEGFACATADVFDFPGSDGKVTRAAAGSSSW